MAVNDSNIIAHLVGYELDGSNGLNATKQLMLLESDLAGVKKATPLVNGTPLVAGQRYGVLITVVNTNTNEDRRVSGTDYLNPEWFKYKAADLPNNLNNIAQFRRGTDSFNSSTNEVILDSRLLDAANNIDVASPRQTINYYFEVDILPQDEQVVISDNTANIYDDLTDANYVTNQVQHPIITQGGGVYPFVLLKAQGSAGSPPPNHARFNTITQPGGIELIPLNILGSLDTLSGVVYFIDVLDEYLEPDLAAMQDDVNSSPYQLDFSFDPQTRVLRFGIDFDYPFADPALALRFALRVRVSNSTPIGTTIVNTFRTEEEINGVPYNTSNPFVITVVGDVDPGQTVVLTKDAITVDSQMNGNAVVVNREESFLYGFSITATDPVNGFTGQIIDILPVGYDWIGGGLDKQEVAAPGAANPQTTTMSAIALQSGQTQVTINCNGMAVVNWSMACYVRPDAPSGLSTNVLVYDPNGENTQSNPAPTIIPPGIEDPIKLIRMDVPIISDLLPLTPIIADGLPVTNLLTYLVEIVVLNRQAFAKSVQFEDVLDDRWEWVGQVGGTEPLPVGNTQVVTSVQYDTPNKRVYKDDLVLPPAIVTSVGVAEINQPSVTRIVFRARPVLQVLPPITTARNKALVAGVYSNETVHPIIVL